MDHLTDEEATKKFTVELSTVEWLMVLGSVMEAISRGILREVLPNLSNRPDVAASIIMAKIAQQAQLDRFEQVGIDMAGIVVKAMLQEGIEKDDRSKDWEGRIRASLN